MFVYFQVLAHGGHGYGTNGRIFPHLPVGWGRELAPMFFLALKYNVFTWAWALVLPILSPFSLWPHLAPTACATQIFEEQRLADQEAFLA